MRASSTHLASFDEWTGFGDIAQIQKGWDWEVIVLHLCSGFLFVYEASVRIVNYCGLLYARR